LNKQHANKERTEVLTTETERLPTQFLERELDLSDTLIQLVQADRNYGHNEHAAQGIEHVTQALRVVRKFISEVESPGDRERIATRLEALEVEFAKLV